MHNDRLAQLRDQYHRDLLEDTVPFWLKHGVDRTHGGFFTCLDRDGCIYCTDKPVVVHRACHLAFSPLCMPSWSKERSGSTWRAKESSFFRAIASIHPASCTSA